MILGAVLAGGRSQRFGSDKALALWNGKALIDHAISCLEPFVTTIIVCGRMAGDRLSIMDRPSANLGPLGGVNAALCYAWTHGYDRVITIPCDAPLIAPALLSALTTVTGDAFLADMPVIGSWRSDHSETLDRHIGGGAGRSMRGWAAFIDATPLDLPCPANINRAEDMDRLHGE